MTARRALLALAVVALVAPLAAVADDEQPVVTVPANMRVEAQNFSGATVTYTASAVDHLGRPIPVTCAPPPGSIFGFGQTTVSCSARDPESGQTASKSFKITVVDTTPPAITVPASSQVTTTSKAGRIVTFTATATDLVDGPVAVVCSPSSGTRFAVGATSVVCTASDRRTNATSKSFVVTVVLAKARTAQASAMLSPTRGARITTPPMLRWRPVRKARFYNIQLYRHGHKVLSAWPSRPRLRLHARWTFAGRTYLLRPGNYSWLVWPAFGSTSHPRFGRLLGFSTFAVVRR